MILLSSLPLCVHHYASRQTGAGTGVLSLLAARAGAAHVYAVEQHAGLAAVAACTAAENNLDHLITILALSSRRVTSEQLERAVDGRCDLVISELLDFSLLGEGLLPTLRDAYDRLLHPAAGCVPHRARLYGQAVSSAEIAGARLAPLPSRPNVGRACAPGRILGVHAHALATDSFARPLTASAALLSIELTATALSVPRRAAIPAVTTALPVLVDGVSDAVVLWWELDVGLAGGVDGDSGAAVENSAAGSVLEAAPWTSSAYQSGHTISTHPAMALHQGFQDHWPQGLWVWDAPVPVAKRAALQVEVTCSDAVNIVLKAPGSVASLAPSLSSALLQGVALPRLQLARLAALSNTVKRDALVAALRQAVRDGDTVVDACDGSTAALLLADAPYLALPQPCLVLALQPAAEPRVLLQQQLEMLVATQTAEKGAFLCTSSVNDMESAVDTVAALHVQIWRGADAGDPWDAEAWPAVDALVGDLHYHALSARPLWAALNFWHLRSALTPVLAPGARIVPARARVLVALIATPELAASHARVQNAAGLDHTAFDAAFGSEYLPDSYFCLAETGCTLLTAPVILAELCFETILDFDSAAGSVVNSELILEAVVAGTGDAMAIWVDADTGPGTPLLVEGHPTAGGLAARQLVRWCSWEVSTPGCAAAHIRSSLDLGSGDLTLEAAPVMSGELGPWETLTAFRRPDKKQTHKQ